MSLSCDRVQCHKNSLLKADRTHALKERLAGLDLFLSILIFHHCCLHFADILKWYQAQITQLRSLPCLLQCSLCNPSHPQPALKSSFRENLRIMVSLNSNLHRTKIKRLRVLIHEAMYITGTNKPKVPRARLVA